MRILSVLPMQQYTDMIVGNHDAKVMKPLPLYPLHHWEGPETLLFGEMHFMPFLHDIQAQQLIGRIRAMP